MSMDFSIGYRVSKDERLSTEVFATHPCTEIGEIRIQDVWASWDVVGLCTYGLAGHRRFLFCSEQTSRRAVL